MRGVIHRFSLGVLLVGQGGRFSWLPDSCHLRLSTGARRTIPCPRWSGGLWLGVVVGDDAEFGDVDMGVVGGGEVEGGDPGLAVVGVPFDGPGDGGGHCVVGLSVTQFAGGGEGVLAGGRVLVEGGVGIPGSRCARVVTDDWFTAISGIVGDVAGGGCGGEGDAVEFDDAGVRTPLPVIGGVDPEPQGCPDDPDQTVLTVFGVDVGANTDGWGVKFDGGHGGVFEVFPVVACPWWGVGWVFPPHAYAWVVGGGFGPAEVEGAVGVAGPVAVGVPDVSAGSEGVADAVELGGVVPGVVALPAGDFGAV